MIVKQRYGKVMRSREGEMIVTAAEQTKKRESRKSYCKFAKKKKKDSANILALQKNNGGLN